MFPDVGFAASDDCTSNGIISILRMSLSAMLLRVQKIISKLAYPELQKSRCTVATVFPTNDPEELLPGKLLQRYLPVH